MSQRNKIKKPDDELIYLYRNILFSLEREICSFLSEFRLLDFVLFVKFVMLCFPFPL